MAVKEVIVVVVVVEVIVVVVVVVVKWLNVSKVIRGEAAVGQRQRNNKNI